MVAPDAGPVAFIVRLAVQGVLALVTGLLYAYVARLVLSRSVSPEAQRANHAFAFWWAAFGAVEFLAGAYNIPSAFGYRDLAMVTTVINVLLFLIAAAIGGLVYYLVYLYTGNPRWFWPIVTFYLALGLAMLYLIAWLDPIGYDESSSTLQLTYRNQLGATPSIALGLVLALPVVLAALGYGSLYFRARDPPQRFRVGLVAGSFLGWFGWSSVSTVLQLQQRFPDSVGLATLNAVIAIAAPLLVILAFRPPRWIRARWNGGMAA
ncbi:MAG: hypothetical protein QOE90_152 [Thermoplasmata archaeon]|jgi:hypothetical protein|nr:hypothetical protein [Thermoplasmata archaeon]